MNKQLLYSIKGIHLMAFRIREIDGIVFAFKDEFIVLDEYWIKEDKKKLKNWWNNVFTSRKSDSALIIFSRLCKQDQRTLK